MTTGPGPFQPDWRPDLAASSRLGQAIQETSLVAESVALSAGWTSRKAIDEPEEEIERGTPIGRIFARFKDAHAHWFWCNHLKRSDPQTAIWHAWRPDRLYCMPCAGRLPDTSVRENMTCDSCGNVGGRTYGMIFSVLPLPLPPRAGKPPEWRPPVLIFAVLCRRCMGSTE